MLCTMKSQIMHVLSVSISVCMCMVGGAAWTGPRGDREKRWCAKNKQTRIQAALMKPSLVLVMRSRAADVTVLSDRPWPEPGAARRSGAVYPEALCVSTSTVTHRKMTVSHQFSKRRERAPPPIAKELGYVEFGHWSKCALSEKL